LLTENDEENVGMLAINERLGYRPLYDQRGWAVELELPSAVPDKSARSDESKRSSSV
jgi:hypothetical protein